MAGKSVTFTKRASQNFRAKSLSVKGTGSGGYITCLKQFTSSDNAMCYQYMKPNFFFELHHGQLTERKGEEREKEIK